ncbi:MAG: Wzz/FepE/Etk N-terminal domain-containing protein, partial [Spirochaetota bacterium]
MENSSKPLNIQDYMAIGLRRKWCIIIPLVCAILVSFAVYKIIPKIYQATTMILVQPQKVPESYIRTTITSSIADRLNTIAQEILSRTRLEKIVQEFDLYTDLRKTQPMEEIVERMRKAIRVHVQDRTLNDRVQNTFSISFEGEAPKTVMAVTNKIASLFIEENLKFREMQAENTSIFLSKELGGLEEQLAKKEEDIKKFRQRHMGQLPQQLEANLRILEQSQQQLKATGERINVAEDRGTILQGQIEQLKKLEQPTVSQPASPRETVASVQEISRERAPEDPIITQWNLLKRELEGAQSRYTDNHPDIINLKIKIANIEPKAKEILQKQEALAEVQRRGTRSTGGVTSAERFPAGPSNPENQRLITQYTDQYNMVLMEARRL